MQNPSKASTRAAIYLRISDDPTGRQEGVDRQRQDALARAAQEGLTILDEHIYQDNDIGASTRSQKKRPQFQKMLEAVEAGEIKTIISYSASRLTRRPMEWERLIELSKKHSMRILTCVSGDPNLTTADGVLGLRFIADVDANEAERLSERLMRQQAQARAEGRSAGKRPFGWGTSGQSSRPTIDGRPGRRPVINRDKLNDTEGPALKQAIQDVLNGRSVASIAREWTKDGLARPRSEKSWPVGVVADMLMRWRNAGVMVYRGEPLEGVVGRWEPACTREELEQVRAVLLNPARDTRTGPSPRSLLTGIATCGNCGRTMIHARDRRQRVDADGHRVTVGKVGVYRCSGFSEPVNRCCRSIRCELADEEVTRAIKTHLVFGRSEGLTPSAEEEQQLRDTATELKGIAEDEEAVTQQLKNRKSSAKPLLKALEEYDLRRKELASIRDRIRGRYLLAGLLGSGPMKDGRVDMDRAVEIGKRFEDLDISQRRELVRSLVTVKILPMSEAEDLPDELRYVDHPECRVIVTTHHGRRLNPLPEREVE